MSLRTRVCSPLLGALVCSRTITIRLGANILAWGSCMLIISITLYIFLLGHHFPFLLCRFGIELGGGEFIRINATESYSQLFDDLRWNCGRNSWATQTTFVLARGGFEAIVDLLESEAPSNISFWQRDLHLGFSFPFTFVLGSDRICNRCWQRTKLLILIHYFF